MMRRRLHNFLLNIALPLFGAGAMALFLLATPVSASFDEVGAGARGAGMADAQTAVADDAAAPFYNPAGLVQIGDRQLSAEMGQYARGLNDGSKLGSTFLGYAQPIVRGNTVIGVSYRSFGVSGLLKENTYLLGAGHRISLDSMGAGGVLSFGANAKLLQRVYTPGSEASNAFSDSGSTTGESDPLLSGSPRSAAFGFDAGLLYQFGPRLNTSVGAAMMNINRPDVAIGAGDKAPSMTKLGVAHRPRWGLLSLEVRRAQRLAGAADTDLAFGAERYIRAGRRSAFTLRGGLASGSRDYKAVTAGASYSFGGLALDYGFSFPLGTLAKTDGQQHLGLSFKFGAQPAALAETRYEKLDLIHAFQYDSLTAHLLLTEVPGLSSDGRSIADRMIVRRFSLGDPGLSAARAELRDAMDDGRDWSLLEAGFTRDLVTEDQRHAAEALKAYTSGGISRALTSVSMMSAEAQKRPTMTALQAMALGEKAAGAFRAGKIKDAIEVVRNLTYVLPASDRVRQVLRQLQAMDTAPLVPVAPEEAAVAQPVVVPAVEPAIPMAPVPVEVPAPVVAPAAETPVPAPLVQEPAPPQAPPVMVAPIIRPAAPMVVPAPAMVPMPMVVPAPAVLPAPAIVPMPALVPPVRPPAAASEKPAAPAKKAPAVAKPADNHTSSQKPAQSQDAKRAWAFYHEAVTREISDYEKIEILGSMLMRFGEAEAGKINAELERLRTRMGRTSGKSGVKR